MTTATENTTQAPAKGVQVTEKAIAKIRAAIGDWKKKQEVAKPVAAEAK